MKKQYELTRDKFLSVLALIFIISMILSNSIIDGRSTWSILGIIGGMLQIIGALGMPIIIMILGYINISDNIYSFYKSIAEKFIIPYITYLIIFKLLSKGDYSTLWTTNVLIGILIIVPYLKILLKNTSEDLLKIFLVIAIVVRVLQIYLPIFGLETEIDMWYLNNWSIFFVLGNLLGRIDNEVVKRKIYKGGLICFIITFISRGIPIDMQIFGVSPTMFLYSSAVFLKLISTDLSKFYTKINTIKYFDFIDKYKTGIYLSSNFVIINILQNRFNLTANRFKVIGGSTFTFVLTIIISSIIAVLLDRYVVGKCILILKKIFRLVSSGRYKNYVKSYKRYIAWLILSLILTFIIEAISRGSVEESISFFRDNGHRFIVNYMIIIVIMSPCLLFKRTYFVYTIISEVLIIVALISYVMFSFRGSPLTYSDFSSIIDGLSIAKQYMNIKIMLGITIVLIICIVLPVKMFKYKIDIESRLKILPILIIPVVTFISHSNIAKAMEKGILKPNQWNIKLSYDDNGFIYSLYNSYSAFKKEKPKNYSEETIATIKKNIEFNFNKSRTSDEENPNIILVQIESVMDPMSIDGIKLSKDPLENFRSISEKYSSGKLQVPTFGGGTARTEFEVLTGMSMDYFSPGEIPHNNDLKKQSVESLAYLLDSNKYEKTLIHNYEGSFYGRNKAYENLGFERYIPLEYMYNIQRPYSFPSDKLVLDNIKNVIEKTEKRDFIFGIGVQTHGGYDHGYKNENSKVKVSGDLDESQLNQVQDFVDDLVMVDEFIKELVEYVENLDEPTILAVYSDHFPSLDVVHEKFSDEEKYLTDYFIFDNIGLQKQDEDLEAYQLYTKILDMLDMNGGIISEFHRTYKEKSGYKEKLELIQYDMLAGNKYILEGKSPYNRTDIKLGIKEIYIENVSIKDNTIEVMGQGFNEYSCINVDGNQVATEYKSSTRLVGNLEDKKVNEITVSQLSMYNKPIGHTETYQVGTKKVKNIQVYD